LHFFFEDPGLNFGNAWYNDMHFHYGYHIYGAAVVSYFDPDWGRSMWEQVLLLIRSIANPSEDDQYFSTWRQKDWYQGHSWASGIAMVFPNGKNQESSSESIAAYEAVALYGKVMVRFFLV
jgi:endo-1,3(4)-beta-glucanase